MDNVLSRTPPPPPPPPPTKVGRGGGRGGDLFLWPFFFTSIFFLLNFHFCFKNSFSRSWTKFIFSIMPMNLFIHAILNPIRMLRVLLRRYFSLFYLHNMIEICFLAFSRFYRILPNKNISVFPCGYRLRNEILWQCIPAFNFSL